VKGYSYTRKTGFENLSSDTSAKPRALIIDDETDICYLLSSILRQKNIQTVFAGSLAEADKALQANASFFYIFLDNHLPDGLGINYIANLKAKFPGSRVIMITAHDSSADRQKAVSDGVDYFIGKPFSKDAIFSTIDRFSGSY
jgi:DNA-binding NtrC family response regulator